MRETDRISEYKLLHGNITDSAVQTFVAYIEGDRSVYQSHLKRIPHVIEHDITPIDAESFYVYIRVQTRETEQQLIAAFSRPSVVMIPPIEYRDDGSVRYTVIGTSEDLDAALDAVPASIQVIIEQVGDYNRNRVAPVSILTDRQREALRLGIDVGYYDVPRTGTVKDIAQEMGCAPGTAAEHVQKAEAAVITSLF
nr:helix-turn-helix domain-containing protein [Halocatena pleomorpha]